MTSRRSRGRRVLTALVVGLVAVTAVPGPSRADEPDRRAPPGTVFFSLDSQPLSAFPRVTRPNHVEIVGVGLFNMARVPATVWIKFQGWCFNRQSERIHFARRPIRVRVPGNPSNPPSASAQRYLVRALRTPQICVHHQYLYDLGLLDGAYYVGAQTRRAESSEYAGTVGNFYIGRPFTRANARWNLTLYSGRRGRDYQAHHTLPVKFEERFRFAGLNIHDPQYLVWWCSRPGVPTNHQSNADEYNRAWARFLRRHPRATAKQILDFRASVSRQYVYRCPR